MSESKLHDFQRDRLSKIIKYARENSPYYNKINPMSYLDLPLMSKQLMMENFDAINTANLEKDKLLEFAKDQAQTNSIDLYEDRFSVGMSSGTSGNKGLTILDSDERDNYTAALFTRKGFPPGVKGKRILFALRRNNPSFMEVGKFGIKIVYVDYTVSPENIIEKINKDRLTVLAGPPSLLQDIARMKEDILHPIEVLICYAEVLTEDVKHYLEEIFKSPVIQIYQGSEGFIASTCRDGFLHINEDMVYLEIEELENGIGKVIITDLFRTTQPILRYELNDMIELTKEPCTCGSIFRRIKSIHGRSDDIFHILDRHGSVRNLFPDYVRRSIIEASNLIESYQARQKSMGYIELRIEFPTQENQEIIKRAIINNLKVYTEKLNADLPEVVFSDVPPERNKKSHKMIRILREF